MIYGKRIRLRAVEKQDLPAFVEWLNDPEVTAGLSLYLPFSMTDEEGWFEQHQASAPDEKSLAVEYRDGDQWRMIGSSGFRAIDRQSHSGEIGLVIGDKSVWGQGLGRELVDLLVRHGFETLNLNRVWLQVHESNRRAVQLYEKAGFVHEGRMRQAVYKNGHYEDILWMSILRSEWDNQKR